MEPDSYEREKKKDRLIRELTIGDDEVLYRIDFKNKSIHVNDKWIRYIKKNKNIIRVWIDYNLLEFLQTKNIELPDELYKHY